jgi:hypothetical protein
MGLGIVRQADQYGLDDGVHAPGEYEAPPEIDPAESRRPQHQQQPSSPSPSPAPSVMAQRMGPRIQAGTMERVSRETSAPILPPGLGG